MVSVPPARQDEDLARSACHGGRKERCLGRSGIGHRTATDLKIDYRLSIGCAYVDVHKVAKVAKVTSYMGQCHTHGHMRQHIQTIGMQSHGCTRMAELGCPMVDPTCIQDPYQFVRNSSYDAEGLKIGRHDSIVTCELQPRA